MSANEFDGRLDRLRKQCTEIASLLDEHLRKEADGWSGPVWHRRTEKWLRYTMVACGVVIFAAQGLRSIGAIELSPNTSSTVKWPLFVCVALGLVASFVYTLFSSISAFWQLAGKPFRSFVGDRCRADVLLLASLARFDESCLLGLAKVTARREELYRGREGMLLGLLDKVPILAAMLVTVCALQLDVVKMPESIDWIGQMLPVPLTGYWAATFAGLFCALRVQMFYARERIGSQASYLSAALEYRKSLSETIAAETTHEREIAAAQENTMNEANGGATLEAGGQRVIVGAAGDGLG